MNMDWNEEAQDFQFPDGTFYNSTELGQTFGPYPYREKSLSNHAYPIYGRSFVFSADGYDITYNDLGVHWNTDHSQRNYHTAQFYCENYIEDKDLFV